MKRVILFMAFLSSQVSESVIYRLNETEYLKMPPLYHLDDYDSCLYHPNGTYCYMDIDLVSDFPSDLLQMIHEYSEHTSTHFNHTQLHYGICITQTCKRHIIESKVADRKLSLERCLNESLYRDYKLKTRLKKVLCTKLDDPMVINSKDIYAAILFVCLVVLNVVGSLYDSCFVKGGKGNRILLSFSVKRNWGKLVECEKMDKFQERLKGIHGMRSICIAGVILTHSPIKFILTAENPHVLEQIYYSLAYHLYLNLTLLVQTFFVLTGCLMTYNFRVYAENNKISWILIPKKIVMRWIRLTPTYAVVLVFTLTWIRFIGSGPLWEVVVGVEVEHCQQDWWWNIIYLNNYVDGSQCMAQTWFLAANMQLYILGLFVCILTNPSKTQNIFLWILFSIGFVIPVIHTYVQDLDAVVLLSPESGRSFFVTDPTYNQSYKRGHTNIPCIVVGIALGNLIYNGLRNENKVEIYKKLGFGYYLTVPMMAALLLSGKIFYEDQPRMSIYLRTVLSAVYKQLMLLLIAIFFIGMVFKFENLYRKVLEWRGWQTPARVSYSAYLLHVAVIRVFAGMTSTLSRVGGALCVKEGVGILFLTYLTAIPFWLFVEAPLSEAILIMLRLSKREDKGGKVKDNIKNQCEPIKTQVLVDDASSVVNIRL